MTRVSAVIDVGSNTIRLLVATFEGGRLVPMHTERVRLGLGQDLEEDGRISAANITAAAEATGELCSQARARGAGSPEVLIASPGRQAENADVFVAALRRATRTEVRMLSADDEAQLAFAGAVAEAELDVPLVAVVDLGGASTEIAVGPPETGPAWFRSVDIGAVRLTTRLLDSSPPEAGAVDKAREEVAQTFAGITPPLPGAALVVGGSARALGAVAGTRLGPDELAEAQRLLAGCSPAEVADRFDVSKHRAQLVLAAALILADVQRRLFVPLRVGDAGIREGALLEALEAAAA